MAWIGINKNVSKNNTVQLQEARSYIRLNQWEKAKECLRTSPKESSKDDERVFRQILNEICDTELRRQNEQIVSKEGQDGEILLIPCKRSRRVRLEPLDDFPQSIFTLSNPNITPSTLVGRRFLSNSWISGSIPEVHCSQINVCMILGVLSGFQLSEDAVHVYYYDMNQEEKCTFFHKLARDTRNTSLFFPFAFLTRDRRELCSEPEGWPIDPSQASELNAGEIPLREASISFLKSWISTHTSNTTLTIHDPACSTGEFLQSIKSTISNIETYASDLSQEMVDFAKSNCFADHYAVSDAAKEAFPGKKFDCIFARFLNSEVVSTKNAIELLKVLGSRVAKGGALVIFGHTPVLVHPFELEFLSGFQMTQSISYCNVSDTICQFYVLERTI